MRGHHLAHESDDGYELVVPFLIDGEAYSDRDREMFVLGFEFCQVYRSLRDGEPGDRITATVRRENEDRIRLLCQRMGRDSSTVAIDATWMSLVIPPGR